MKNKQKSHYFMETAIQEGLKGVSSGEGGPFGAVIIFEGKIIGKAHNTVIKTNDPTAHAEVNVIRQVSEKLDRFDLSDCELFTTCEPCPMCLGAIIWAKIKNVYYGCSREDAEKIGFDDKLIYDHIKGELKNPVLNLCQIQREVCLPLFTKWQELEKNIQY